MGLLCDSGRCQILLGPTWAHERLLRDLPLGRSKKNSGLFREEPCVRVGVCLLYAACLLILSRLACPLGSRSAGPCFLTAARRIALVAIHRLSLCLTDLCMSLVMISCVQLLNSCFSSLVYVLASPRLGLDIHQPALVLVAYSRVCNKQLESYPLCPSDHDTTACTTLHIQRCTYILLVCSHLPLGPAIAFTCASFVDLVWMHGCKFSARAVKRCRADETLGTSAR